MAATLVAAVVVVAVVVWPEPAPGGDPAAATPKPNPTATPSSGAEPPTVESTREVSIDGNTVTVEEVSDVVDGKSTVAAPATNTPLGLTLLHTSVVTPDGRSRSFDDPLTLSSSGSLTVRNRYRLGDCPDVIPGQWPVATSFPDATRTFTREDGPLHTAYALCPKATPRAKQLGALQGKLADTAADAVTVRLVWTGAQPLTVRAVGSASGVAVATPDAGCNDACVAVIAPRTATPLLFTPVDPCPPATTSDRLTLVVRGGADDVVALRVQGLAKALCR